MSLNSETQNLTDQSVGTKGCRIICHND